MKVNLHTHSIYSDGDETPERLVELAKEASVEVLALTDHNTFEGYPRFEKACHELGVSYIKGVEIDCIQSEIGFHQELLAYFPNGGEECLNEVLIRKQKARRERVLRALERATRLFDTPKLEIGQLEKMEIAQKGAIGMLSNKLVYCYMIAVKPELPSYQNIQKMQQWKETWKREGADSADTLYELIPLVAQNGGYPVLAHFGFHFEADPKKMRAQADEYIDHLRYMKSLGLWGLELHPYRYYPQKDEINDIIKGWAEAAGLNLTTGSDFHGGKQSCHQIFEWYGVDFKGFSSS